MAGEECFESYAPPRMALTTIGDNPHCAGISLRDLFPRLGGGSFCHASAALPPISTYLVAVHNQIAAVSDNRTSCQVIHHLCNTRERRMRLKFSCPQIPQAYLSPALTPINILANLCMNVAAKQPMT